jgi:hypothetical protein
MKKSSVLTLCVVAVLLMGCSLTSLLPKPSSNTKDQSTDQPQIEIFKTETPPNPVPVSFNDGLASLNSYVMTIIVRSVGPNPAQSNSTQIVNTRSNDADASYTQITSAVVPADGGDPSNSNTSLYKIGNDQCTGNEEEWSWQSSTPEETEMQSLVSSMIGLTPLIDDPVFVAAETVNGIATNHFNFKVAGLGAKSGAIVNINQGDYWLAIDGQYIVKYVLVIEMSKSANNEVLHEEVSIDVNQINQPVSVVFPQACLDAKAAQ